MKILSLIAFINSYSFILIAIYLYRLNPKENLNRHGAAVNVCFAVWSFAGAFMYMAPTAEQAFFWHRVSALGWILFCPFMAQFFLILSQRMQKIKSVWIYILLYGFPVILLFKTFLGERTPIAKSMLQSTSGQGWTYVTNIESIWFWLYLLLIASYMAVSLYSAGIWAKESKRLRYIKQAQSIIVLDLVMVVIGFITDVIVPTISPLLPPLFEILSILWGVGLVLIVKNYHLMSVNDVVSPELILKTVMDPIILIDPQGVIRQCNRATMELLKYDKDQIIGKKLSFFYKSGQYKQENLDRLRAEKELRDKDIELVDALGNSINVVASFSVAESKLDGVVGVVVSFHDVTEFRKLAESLEQIANNDKLTKLPNRRYFFTKLSEALDIYKHSGDEFTLIFMDLDGFKAVNDSFGHDIGDKLLTEIAQRLKEVERESDTIARIGGDEFVLLLQENVTNGTLDSIVTRIKHQFKHPMVIDGHTCMVGISIGISRCPEDGISKTELMKKADLQMYQHKLGKKRKKNE